MGKIYLGETEITPTLDVPVDKTMYGATLGMILGDEPVGDLSFDGVTEANSFLFYGKFSGKKFHAGSVTISFPDLVENGTSGLGYMFYSDIWGARQEAITVSFPKLKTIKVNGMKNFMGGALSSANVGNQIAVLEFPLLERIEASGWEDAFGAAVSRTCLLEELNLPSLTTINGLNALSNAFENQTNLKRLSFPALTTISGNNAMSATFYGCTSLTSISFPALTTISNTGFGNSTASYIFYGCTGLTEIHFRAVAQAVVEAVRGYSTKWGAENATIYFDL